MEIDEMKKALLIDKHGLDAELVQQPHLYQLCAEEHVHAVSIADDAKSQMKKAEAAAYLEIRADIEKDTGKKPTDSQLQAEVACDKDVIKAQAEFRAAKEQENHWLALKESFAQRSYVLKDLAGLFQAGYYQTNAAKGGENKVAETQAESVRAAQTEARAAKAETEEAEEEKPTRGPGRRRRAAKEPKQEELEDQLEEAAEETQEEEEAAPRRRRSRSDKEPEEAVEEKQEEKPRRRRRNPEPAADAEETEEQPAEEEAEEEAPRRRRRRRS